MLLVLSNALVSTVVGYLIWSHELNLWVKTLFILWISYCVSAAVLSTLFLNPLATHIAKKKKFAVNTYAYKAIIQPLAMDTALTMICLTSFGIAIVLSCISYFFWLQ